MSLTPITLIMFVVFAPHTMVTKTLREKEAEQMSVRAIESKEQVTLGDEIA